MVWTGSGLRRLAPCLEALFDQADARWPNRPTESDGTLGDLAHAARPSDHNPADDPADIDKTLWVCAADLTDALPGPIAHAWLDDVRKRRDPRCKYGISEGQAFYSYSKPGRPAWTWVPYDGVNAHEKHGHLSVHNTAAARNDLRPWFPPQDGNSNHPLEEEDVTPCILRLGRKRIVIRVASGSTDTPAGSAEWKTDGGPWLDIGGKFKSGLSAFTTGDGTFEVAGTGMDGKTYVNAYNGGVFVGWSSLG